MSPHFPSENFTVFFMGLKTEGFYRVKRVPVVPILQSFFQLSFTIVLRYLKSPEFRNGLEYACSWLVELFCPLRGNLPENALQPGKGSYTSPSPLLVCSGPTKTFPPQLFKSFIGRQDPCNILCRGDGNEFPALHMLSSPIAMNICEASCFSALNFTVGGF